MIMEIVVVGPLGVNCIILGDEESREGVVVDAGGDPQLILDTVKRHGLSVKYLINTHAHFDHVGGNRAVAQATGAPLLIHEADVPLLSRASQSAMNYGMTVDPSPHPARFLTDGLELHFGAHTIQVLHTPGHTVGGCSLYLKDQGVVLTGDTLFQDSVGRTDLPGGSHETLIASIRKKLLTLPDETIVWPGHGASTTIGRERRGNPYLS